MLFSEDTLADFFEKQVERLPDHEFLIYPDRNLSSFLMCSRTGMCLWTHSIFLIPSLARDISLTLLIISPIKIK